MNSGPFAWTFPAPSPDLPVADLIAESSQFRALCAHRTAISDLMVAKRSELRKRNGQPRRRHPLDDPAERMRKLAIETGYDIRHDLFLKAPLEPWTSDRPVVGMRAYSDLMRGRPGADLLEHWSGEYLAELEWMRDEELVTISEDRLRIVPLSDEAPKQGRKYPGAPVVDSLARIGRQLRGQARGIIGAAFANACRRRARKRGKQPGKMTAAGLQIAVRELCEEANKIKARRPDLDEYRYLSVDTCRRVIREMLAAGLLTEAEPPRAVREGRSWKTIPRTFEIPQPRGVTRVRAASSGPP